MSNRVTHFEIACEHPEKSIEFFSLAFGWTFQQYGSEHYWMATTGNTAQPGINGAIMKKRDPKQPIINSISVENIEDTLARIESAGGRTVVAKTAVPSMGWIAYFADPEENIHGIWQDDNDAK